MSNFGLFSSKWKLFPLDCSTNHKAVSSCLLPLPCIPSVPQPLHYENDSYPEFVLFRLNSSSLPSSCYQSGINPNESWLTWKFYPQPLIWYHLGPEIKKILSTPGFRIIVLSRESFWKSRKSSSLDLLIRLSLPPQISWSRTFDFSLMRVLNSSWKTKPRSTHYLVYDE